MMKVGDVSSDFEKETSVDEKSNARSACNSGFWLDRLFVDRCDQKSGLVARRENDPHAPRADECPLEDPASGKFGPVDASAGIRGERMEARAIRRARLEDDRGAIRGEGSQIAVPRALVRSFQQELHLTCLCVDERERSGERSRGGLEDEPSSIRRQPKDRRRDPFDQAKRHAVARKARWLSNEKDRAGGSIKVG